MEIGCGNEYCSIFDKKKNKVFLISLNDNDNKKYNIKDLKLSINFPNYKIKKFEIGGSHCLILFENNDLYSFGKNIYGQCGHDNDIYKHIKEDDIKKIDFFSNTLIYGKIKNIYCNDQNSFVLLENNELYTFGFNSRSYEPKLIMHGITINDFYYNKRSDEIFISTISNVYGKNSFWNYNETDNEVIFIKDRPNTKKYIFSDAIDYYININNWNIPKANFGYINMETPLKYFMKANDNNKMLKKIIQTNFFIYFLLEDGNIYHKNSIGKIEKNNLFEQKKIIDICSTRNDIILALSDDDKIYITHKECTPYNIY